MISAAILHNHLNKNKSMETIIEEFNEKTNKISQNWWSQAKLRLWKFRSGNNTQYITYNFKIHTHTICFLSDQLIDRSYNECQPRWSGLDGDHSFYNNIGTDLFGYVRRNVQQPVEHSRIASVCKETSVKMRGIDAKVVEESIPQDCQHVSAESKCEWRSLIEIERGIGKWTESWTEFSLDRQAILND